MSIFLNVSSDNDTYFLHWSLTTQGQRNIQGEKYLLLDTYKKDIFLIHLTSKVLDKLVSAINI